jgi:hypothetical protein
MFGDLEFFADLGDFRGFVDLVCLVFMRQTPACGLLADFYHREGREK